MMTMIDKHGRLLGRVNLLDAVVVMFLLGLLPVAYGAYLLFRPATPRIDSIEQVEITAEERRIAAGNALSAKLKVTGSGFNPLMRAEVAGMPALGFVFETPNSADVLVGTVPEGVHDLVLFDGVNEVARASGAVAIRPERTATVRLVGHFANLYPSTGETLTVGMDLDGRGRIVALGPVEPARLRVTLGAGVTDLPIEERFERSAVIDAYCDPGLRDSPCAISGRILDDNAQLTVVLPPGFVFAIEEVLPASPPRVFHVRVRFTGGNELDLVTPGDSDRLLDDRAAVVRSLVPRSHPAGLTTLTVTLRAGLDESRDGWRYRGRPVRPGEAFALDTDRYLVHGVVEAIEPLDDKGDP